MSSRHQSRRGAKRQQELAGKAQHLRQHPTLSEQKLWAELSGGRLGVAFRRQVVMGRYIADFASSEARLVVEVDGGVHCERVRLEARRDEQLRRAGYRVVRVPAELVVTHVAVALALVCEALARR